LVNDSLQIQQRFKYLRQWFLTWGKFTPGGKFHLPRG